MTWNYITICVSILVALLLCLLEYQRAQKSFLWLRMVSVCIAVTALACINLPLSYRAGFERNRNEAVLLTAHFDRDSLAVLKGKKTFTLDGAISKDLKNVNLVSSIEDLLLADSTITSLHILGDGLNQTQIAQLEEMPVKYTGPKAASGIARISWNGQLQAGDQLKVQGQCQFSGPGKLKLVLKGFGTSLDSASIPSGGTNFELATTPKLEGRAVFNLLVIAGKDTIEKEDLPLEVRPVKPLRLLVFNSSPNFETRFLKNWLTVKGYHAVIRSAISKNKYSTEFVNMAEQPAEKLTFSLLDKIDVVLGDLSVFKTLSTYENKILEQEVSQKGVGLLIRADSSDKQKSWIQAGFAIEKERAKLNAPVSLVIRGKKSPAARLNYDGNYLVNKDAFQVLVDDGNKHAIAASNLYHKGKIVLTVLNNTYNWMLAGNDDDYSMFWSLLLAQASPRTAAEEKWSVITPIPITDEKVKLQIQTLLAGKTIVNGISVATVQHAVLPFQWQAEAWPDHAGWQQVRQAGKIAAWWYAWPQTAWQHITALKKQSLTQLYAAKHALNRSVTKQIQANSYTELPKIYFYMLFLAAAVFLWIESKLSE